MLQTFYLFLEQITDFVPWWSRSLISMILTIISRLPEKCLGLNGKTFLIGTYGHKRHISTTLGAIWIFFHFMIVFSRMIEVGAKVGKANGLRVLLDAETFDYTFHLSASEGFKMAVQHHLGNYFNMKIDVITNCTFRNATCISSSFFLRKSKNSLTSLNKTIFLSL